MITLQLNDGLETVIDDADYELVRGYNWKAYRIVTSGAERGSAKYRVMSHIGKQTILMHRIIMGCERGDGKIVDHRNRNPLVNTRDNLRLVTPSENSINKEKQSGIRHSKYFGVSRDVNRTGKSWQAKIKGWKDGRRVSLARYFYEETDAARQYDDWAVDVHGPELAHLNFPELYRGK